MECLSVSAFPSKHARSDSEAFWLWPVMAITASMQPESGWIRLPASNSVQFFQKRPGSCHAKPAQIRSGWPGHVLAKHIWSGSKPVHWAWFWPNANGLIPIFCFRLGCVLSISLDHTVQNQPRSDLVLADCIRFWPNRSGPEASWCTRIIGPASGQHF